MTAGTTNYCWVRAYDFALKRYHIDAHHSWSKKTRGSVSIINGEGAGADAVWRSTSTARAYQRYFPVAGQSAASSAEYAAYTLPGQNGTNVLCLVADPNFAGGTTFTGWQIKDTDFEHLYESATNYISVRCLYSYGKDHGGRGRFLREKRYDAADAPSLTQPLNASATKPAYTDFQMAGRFGLASGTHSVFAYRFADSDFSAVFVSTYTVSLNYSAALPRRPITGKCRPKIALTTGPPTLQPTRWQLTRHRLPPSR